MRSQKNISMNRGELWIGAEGGYASKPRPALIVQSDRYSQDESVVTCLVTSHATDGSGLEYRVSLPRSSSDGLHTDSFVMLDKIPRPSGAETPPQAVQCP
jgi:mRNA interferase MazF